MFSVFFQNIPPIADYDSTYIDGLFPFARLTGILSCPFTIIGNLENARCLYDIDDLLFKKIYLKCSES